MSRYVFPVFISLCVIALFLLPSSLGVAQGSYFLLPVSSFNDDYIYDPPFVSAVFSAPNVGFSGDCLGSGFTYCGASLSLYRDTSMTIYGVVADFVEYERSDDPSSGWLLVGTSSEFLPDHTGVIQLTTEQSLSTPLIEPYRWCATDIDSSNITHLDCSNISTHWHDAANGNAPEEQHRNSLYVGTRRGSSDFSFDMSVNLYWLVVDCPGGTSPDPYGVCVLDPTVTPTVTPTIVPGSGYDLDCVVGTGIPGTTPGQTISANLLDNGSFEDVGFQPGNSSQPSSWYGPDDWELDGLVKPWTLYDSGLGCGSDVVCSPDGIMSLRSSQHLPGFPGDYRYGRVCQDVYLMPGSYNLRVGYDYQEVLNDVPEPNYWSHWHVDVQAGVFVWNRLLRDPSVPNPPRWSTHVYTSTNTISGGGFQFCVSGDYYGYSPAHIPTIDKIYLHALEIGTGQVFCQGPLDQEDIATPTPSSTPWPTIPPISTLVLPTYGPGPTLDPGVGLTPRPTSCFGVSEDEPWMPGAVVDGYHAITDNSMPSAQWCFGVSDIGFASDHPIRAVFDPEDLLGVLVPAVGLLILSWIRRR